MGTLIGSIIQYRQFGNHILRGIQSSQENDIDYVLHKAMAECARQLRYNFHSPHEMSQEKHLHKCDALGS